MRVEIYSDVVCPWCYIGKRRFEAALSEMARRDGAGRPDIEIVGRPYQLDPTAPATPTPVIDAYARKFGGPEQAFRIIDHVTQVAAGEGLQFRMEEAVRANTFDAHRVLWLAEREGGSALQNAVKERLLRAYFSEGRDVGDHATLVALAAEAGMDEGIVGDALACDTAAAEVRAELATATERGITAVPTFVIDGQWGIPGAQDAEVFVRVLDKMMMRENPAAGSD